MVRCCASFSRIKVQAPLTQLKVAVGQAAHVQGVINVLAAGGVHAAHCQVAQVRPAQHARRGVRGAGHGGTAGRRWIRKNDE